VLVGFVVLVVSSRQYATRIKTSALALTRGERRGGVRETCNVTMLARVARLDTL